MVLFAMVARMVRSLRLAILLVISRSSTALTCFKGHDLRMLVKDSTGNVCVIYERGSCDKPENQQLFFDSLRVRDPREQLEPPSHTCQVLTMAQAVEVSINARRRVTVCAELNGRCGLYVGGTRDRIPACFCHDELCNVLFLAEIMLRNSLNSKPQLPDAGSWRFMKEAYSMTLIEMLCMLSAVRRLDFHPGLPLLTTTPSTTTPSAPPKMDEEKKEEGPMIYLKQADLVIIIAVGTIGLFLFCGIMTACWFCRASPPQQQVRLNVRRRVIRRPVYRYGSSSTERNW